MIYPYNVSGLAIPSSVTNNYNSPLVAIAVYNNSPITWTVSEQPGGPVLGLVPAFYSLSIPMVGNNPYCLTANTGAAVAGSSLTVFAYDQSEGASPLPFANPYGPNSWGSGASPTPGTLAGVLPADQVLAWQIQQLIDVFTGLTLVGGSAKRLANLVIFPPSSQASIFVTRIGTDGNPVSTSTAVVIPATATAVLLTAAFFPLAGVLTPGDSMSFHYDIASQPESTLRFNDPAGITAANMAAALIPCNGNAIFTRAVVTGAINWQLTLRLLGYVEAA